MGHIIGEIADIVFAEDKVASSFDFLSDADRSYVRRRIVPSDRLQRENNLLNVAFWPVVPPIADPRHGSSILSMAYLALAFEPLGRRLIADAIRSRHLSSGVKISDHIRNIVGEFLPAARYAPEFLWKRYGAAARIPGLFVTNKERRYGLSYHAEHSPDPDSRVRLSDETDSLGLPRLEIAIRFPRSDAESIVRAHTILKGWLESSGIGTLQYRQHEEDSVAAVLARASHGTHQIGTIRMGHTRKDGVVDRDLQTFDIPNLYVASTAVMPTSGQANPTLTGVAFGARLAEHLSSV
jgi:hypothetical protein